MQDRNDQDGQRTPGHGSFTGDGAQGERGYRGSAAPDVPPGSVPGGSYGAGGGWRQGGYERGNFDPRLEEQARRSRSYRARPNRGRPADSYEGGADFERGDWEGAGDWHGQPRSPRNDAAAWEDTGYGEARGGNWGALGGSAGHGGGSPAREGMMQGRSGWTGGFAPEGTWHSEHASAPQEPGDWRGTGEWGYRGGTMRGTAEWHRAGGDRPPRMAPWEVPGPHTGRGPDGYRRSEQAIRDDVCERLTRHGELDASSISVRVEDGEVILEGTVESRIAKRMAEDAAESVSGVRDVQNRLRVRD